MGVPENELLVKFARELREIVESFEEEAEILSQEDVLREIEESEIAYREGDTVEFKDIEDVKREMEL